MRIGKDSNMINPVNENISNKKGIMPFNKYLEFEHS
jgi:hypothetical protein